MGDDCKDYKNKSKNCQLDDEKCANITLSHNITTFVSPAPLLKTITLIDDTNEDRWQSENIWEKYGLRCRKNFFRYL